MTEEQRALIRRIYDATNRRDIDELRRLGGTDPDFEWSSSEDEIDAVSRRGTEDSIAYFRELFELFDELVTEIEEEIDLGPDQAIFVVSHRVRGASSGASAERREAHLWTLAGETVTSLREFRSVEEARRAAVGRPTPRATRT